MHCHLDCNDKWNILSLLQSVATRLSSCWSICFIIQCMRTKKEKLAQYSNMGDTVYVLYGYFHSKFHWTFGSKSVLMALFQSPLE